MGLWTRCIFPIMRIFKNMAILRQQAKPVRVCLGGGNALLKALQWYKYAARIESHWCKSKYILMSERHCNVVFRERGKNLSSCPVVKWKIVQDHGLLYVSYITLWWLHYLSDVVVGFLIDFYKTGCKHYFINKALAYW